MKLGISVAVKYLFCIYKDLFNRKSKAKWEILMRRAGDLLDKWSCNNYSFNISKSEKHKCCMLQWLSDLISIPSGALVTRGYWNIVCCSEWLIAGVLRFIMCVSSASTRIIDTNQSVNLGPDAKNIRKSPNLILIDAI